MPEIVGWLALIFDVVLAVGLGGLAVYFYTQLQAARRQHIQAESDAADRLVRAKEEAERILDDARAQQKGLILEAKDEQIRLRTALETEHREQRIEIARLESRVRQKEESLDRKIEQLEARDRKLQNREKEADQLRAQLDRAHE